MPKFSKGPVDFVDLLTQQGRKVYDALLPTIQEEHDGWTVVIDLDPVWNDVTHVVAQTSAEAIVLARQAFGHPMITYSRGICENSLCTEAVSMDFP